MIPVATDPNVPLFLAQEIRTRMTALADPDFPIAVGWIAGKEWVPPPSNPNATPPKWQVVIRDDGIADDELLTGECSIGVSVLAGSKDYPEPARRLAVIVKTIIKQTPRAEAGNPVAAVTSFLGPYAVDDPSTFARRYSAVTLSVVGLP